MISTGRVFGVLLGLICMFNAVGCVFSGGGSGDGTGPLLGPTQGGATEVIPATPLRGSTASVRFRLVYPDGTRQAPNAGILAAGAGGASVTVTLKIIDLANPVEPVVTLSRTVPVIDQRADVSFPGLPPRTVVGSFEILGGAKNGYSAYRGAADLIPGTNTVDLVPRGASMTQDVVAQVIEDLGASPNAQAALLPRLANEVRNVVEYVRQQETITFRRAYEVFLAQLPQSISKISVGGIFTAPGGGTFASLRISGPRGGIRGAGRSRRVAARVLINPHKPNQQATVSMDLTVSDDQKTLTLDPVTLPAPIGKCEISIEVLPATFTPTTDPIFKGYDVQTAQPATQMASPAILQVTPASTAVALAYDQWRGKPDTHNQTVDDFLVQNPEVSTLTEKIVTQLETILSTTSGPDETFSWPTEVKTEVVAVASETAVIPRSSVIEGTIRDEATDLPLPGVFVGVAETDYSDITDENGYFQIMDLPPGTYDLVIRRDGYEPVSFPGVTLTASRRGSRNASRRIILLHD